MERKYQQLSFFLFTGVFFSELQGIYFKGYGSNGLEECFIESLDPRQENNFIMHRNALRPFRKNVVEESAGYSVYYCPFISSKVLVLLGYIFDKMNLGEFNLLYEYLEKNVQNLSPEEFVMIISALASLDANGVLDFILWFCPLQQEDKVIALLQDQGLTEAAEKINFLKSLITLKVGTKAIPLSGILARYIPRIRNYFYAYFTGTSDVDAIKNFDFALLPVQITMWYESCCQNNPNYSFDTCFIPGFDPEQYEDFFKKFFNLITYYNKNKGSKNIVEQLKNCNDEEFVKFALFYLERFEFLDEYTSFNSGAILDNPVTKRCNNLRKNINKFLINDRASILQNDYPDLSPDDVIKCYSPHHIVSRSGKYCEKPKTKQLSKKQKTIIAGTLTSVVAFTPWLVKKVKKWFKNWQKRNAALKAAKKSEVETILVKQ